MRNFFFTLLRLTRNSGLPEFRTSGIPDVGNSISENPELRGNLTEFLTEFRKLRKEPEIPVNYPEITEKTGNSGQKPGNYGLFHIPII